jgi:hypothetical protein
MLAEKKRVFGMSDELANLKLSTFKRLRKVQDEIDERLNDAAEKLRITPKITPLMTIRWELPPFSSASPARRADPGRSVHRATQRKEDA